MKWNPLFFIFCFFIFSEAFCQSGKNPFEVEGRSPIATDLRTQDQDTVNTVTETQIDAQKNPFEVSHVPLRKSKVNTEEVANPGTGVTLTAPTVSNSFIFWVMLISWALLAIVLTNKRRLFSNLVRSLLNENLLKLTKRQENNGLNLHYILLYIIYFINMSIFLYLLADRVGVRFWIMLLGGVLATYLIRHLALYLMSVLFPLDKEASLYNYCIMVFNLVIGIVLIPFNLALAFGAEDLATPATYISLVIVGILLLLRYIRGFFIAANKALDNLFVFFIYLCTLEIAPTLIIMRFLSSFS